MNQADMLRIVELIEKYSNLQKVADEGFFNELVDFVVHSYGIEDYLKGIVIIKEGKEKNPEYKKYMEGISGLLGSAAYDTVTRELVIYEKNIKHFVLADVRASEITNLYLGVNVLIAQIILHELEHALQKKQIIEGDTLESEIFRSIYFGDQETTLTYDFSPFERLAELNSLRTIVEISSLISFMDPKLIELLEQVITKTLEKGYDFSESNDGRFIGPLEQYINLHNGSLEEPLRLVSKLDDSEKLAYGVTISLEEYQKSINSSTKKM